jgi:hypothetical protein
MSETPEEMYKRLIEQSDKHISKLRSIAIIIGRSDEIKLINHYRAQVQVLREALESDPNYIEVDRIISDYLGKPDDIFDKYHLDCGEIQALFLRVNKRPEVKKALEATTDKWGE